MEYKKPSELYEALEMPRRIARESVIAILSTLDGKSYDLTLDSEGRSEEDDEYNSDDVFDRRVWGEGYSKYNIENIFLTRVYLDENNDIKVDVCGDESDSTCFRYGIIYSIIDLYARLYNDLIAK